MGALINSAYNPNSGWAVPGSGRSPTVGAFEYAYGAVANGLANIGYNWIRDQLDRPSPPPKPPAPRSVDGPRGPLPARSDERRGGKECVSTGRYRWSPSQ